MKAAPVSRRRPTREGSNRPLSASCSRRSSRNCCSRSSTSCCSRSCSRSSRSCCSRSSTSFRGEVQQPLRRRRARHLAIGRAGKARLRGTHDGERRAGGGEGQKLVHDVILRLSLRRRCMPTTGRTAEGAVFIPRFPTRRRDRAPRARHGGTSRPLPRLRGGCAHAGPPRPPSRRGSPPQPRARRVGLG